MWLQEIALAVGTAGSEASAESALRQWSERRAEDDAFADVIFQSAAMAYMGGQLFVRDVEVPAQVRKLDVQVGPEAQFFGLPFDEAVELFSRRRVVSPEEFRANLDQMRSRSFTATRLATDQVRQRAFDALIEVMRTGGTFEDFADAVRNEEASLGIEPSNHSYLRTVFNTNVVSAYSAGRDRQLSDPSVIEAIPYRLYVAVMDARVRPEHAALDGTVWDARETDEWRRFQGPNGFNCRCQVVSREEAPRTPVSAVRHPEPDFAGVPNLSIDGDAPYTPAPPAAPEQPEPAPVAAPEPSGRLGQQLTPAPGVQEIRSRLAALRYEDGDPVQIVRVEQATAEAATPEVRAGIESWQDAWKHDSSRSAELADAGLAAVGDAPAHVPAETAEAARFLYAATQESLENLGVESQRLFRGIGGAQAQEVRDAVAAARAAGETHVRVRVRPLASWSADPDVARAFADQPTGAKSVEVTAGTGVVIRSQVDRSRVFASHRVDDGMSHQAAESEWVVIHPDGYAEIPIDDIEFR